MRLECQRTQFGGRGRRLGALREKYVKYVNCISVCTVSRIEAQKFVFVHATKRIVEPKFQSQVEIMASKMAIVAAAAAAAFVGAASAGAVTVDSSLPRVSINGEEYTSTPNGYILSHCVYEIPHGAESRRDDVRESSCWFFFFFRFTFFASLSRVFFFFFFAFFWLFMHGPGLLV